MKGGLIHLDSALVSTVTETVLHVRRDSDLPDLESARDRLRCLRRDRRLGATVVVHGGSYPLERTFLLTEEDSGTESEPVRYCAAEGEEVRVVGGRALDGFSPVEDESVLARLCPEARGQVGVCDLKDSGITDFGRFASRGFGRPTTPAHMELFFRGGRMDVARWPNGDFATIGAAVELIPEGDGHGGELGQLGAGFTYPGDRPRRWRDLSDVWIHGYWAWDWANSYEQIASYDADTGLIRTRPPHGLYGFRAGQRFYFLNILEELDRAGEYYVDAGRGLLYFWPPEEIGPGEVVVSVLEEPLIRFDGACHVEVSGMALECGRGNGVEICGGVGVAVAGCAIRRMGNHAVVVDGGAGHRVRGCEICHTGDGGIHLRGGDRRTLTAAGHEADNNHIHDMGQWSRCYQPAVTVSGVGQRVTHNLIHDGPHNAIQLSGNDHLVEFNHIHHVCQESGDVGAFYMGRDWTERGNVIRHNLFHHTQGYGMGSMAVYLDDCASGATVFGNIFYRCTRAAFVGGGRGNRIENNIFVDCEPAISVDGRGLDARPVWSEMIQVTMKERLDAVHPSEPPYSVRYPDLRELEPYYCRREGVPPEGNLILRNICWGGEWLDVHWLADPKIVATQFNLVDEDPLFASPRFTRTAAEDADSRWEVTAADFRLRTDSPAFELGFRPIPLDDIGLYLDDARTCLPVASAGASSGPESA